MGDRGLPRPPREPRPQREAGAAPGHRDDPTCHLSALLTLGDGSQGKWFLPEAAVWGVTQPWMARPVPRALPPQASVPDPHTQLEEVGSRGKACRLCFGA